MAVLFPLLAWEAVGGYSGKHLLMRKWTKARQEIQQFTPQAYHFNHC